MVGIAPVLLTRQFSTSQMFSIMFKSGDLGGKVDDIHVVLWTSDPFCAFRPVERRPKHNEEKIWIFPEFLVYFVLLLLLLFVAAHFFDAMSTFYQ